MKSRTLHYDAALFVCMGGSCKDKKAKKLADNIKKVLKDRKLDDRVHVNRTGCLKCCGGDGPVVVVVPSGDRLTHVKPKDAEAVVDHVVKAKRMKA
ncbi:MAG: (2Fe-2S) ferredoxin domain-containing protein [bacterium]|nr:(2Fe-2S) ferredoxin domain-containing protein [bacterium]